MLIVDEAHELVSRVTGVATGELTPGEVNRAVRRAAKLVNEKAADQLQTAAEGFERLMELALPGRLEEIPEDLGYALMALRDACRTVISAIGATRDKSVQDEDAVRKQALASVENVHDVAERITNGSEWDVVWYERHDRFGASLRVAPHVRLRPAAGEALRGPFGGADVRHAEAGRRLQRCRRLAGPGPRRHRGRRTIPKWKGIDVGSPFDYPKQGILYVAKHLARPAPGRRPRGHARRTHRTDPGGRRPHPRACSPRCGRPSWPPKSCGPGSPSSRSSSRARRRWASSSRPSRPTRTCLFGTLSLWQGVDVPGPNCQLVVMDKIPFPRPDDPLMSARQKAVEDAGGNGFMAVAATHAALLMAQGAGRLVRASGDRGVVAVLDQRLATARYGSYPEGVTARLLVHDGP